IADESCRLHLSDHPQHVSAIIFLLVTQAVEPDERNGSVASEQFTQLELHVGKIALPLRALWLTMQFSLVGRWYRGIWGGAGLEGSSKTRGHVVFMTGLREVRHDVPAIRCSGDLVVGVGRVEHAKSS